MKFYATIISERDSRAGKKGGNEYLQVELSAFGKIVGYVVLEITEDAQGEPLQYNLKFSAHRQAIDWVMLKQGHQANAEKNLQSCCSKAATSTPCSTVPAARSRARA